MTYEKHIAALTAYNNAGADDLDPEVVDAAIELMQAAEPRNMEADRERNMRLRKHLQRILDGGYYQQADDAIGEMCAAVRAEATAGVGMQEFRRLEARLHDVECRLTAEAAECAAGMNRMRDAYERTMQDAKAKLAAADTKLATLRTATEQAYLLLEDRTFSPSERVEAMVSARRELRTALEESK